MQGTHAWRRTGFIAALTVLPLLLGGCLSKEDTQKSFSGDIENQLTGSVGDGPVAGSSMRVRRNDAEVLEEFTSDTYADYEALVKTKGSYYPLTVEARNGTDLVTNLPPELTLYACVPNPGNKTTANVNLFSTLALEIARDMSGGINSNNCGKAEQLAVEVFNGGLTSLESSGPSSTKIDSSNVAEIVKASETVSEIVKRTRDYQQMFGQSLSADQIMEALGSDAIDGVIDGRGGSRVDPRSAAISSIAAVQAYLEAASNELHVNGADATDAMNAVIDKISGNTAQETVGDQTVTAEMITAVNVGLSAAYEVMQSQKILDLWKATTGLQAGMEDTFVQTLLPADYSTTLDDALMYVAGGDTATVDTVNTVVRSGGKPLPSGTTPPTNSPPTISGNPPASVTAGNQYSFTPTASDADNDTLTFSVSGLPGWANFSQSTGRISGTPGDVDVGTYSNISITVSDGQASDTLGPFSITVQAISLGSVTLSWTPPTQNEDGTPLTDLAGYKIYWGTTPGVYPNSVTLSNPGLTSYVVENLVPGTYEFVATSFNSAGMESVYSNPATRTVN